MPIPNNPPINGTGDGGQSFKSRKIFGFVLMVISIIGLVAVTTKMGTPVEIANTALYMIGAGGLFSIGGQAAVDVVLRSKYAAPAPGESKTMIKETVVSSGPGSGSGTP